MSSNQLCHRIVRNRDGGVTPGRHCDWSHQSVGHQERMAAHIERIHNHPCQCGSGLVYGRCCIGRMNQEYYELRHRMGKGRAQ
jgi:hypothetical protein